MGVFVSMHIPYSRHNILEVLPSFEGRNCIYIERMDIRLAKIMDIKATDRGISATATTLPSQGLSVGGNSWTIGVNWESFSFSPTYWSAGYSGWRIFFDEVIIAKVLDIVSRLPPGKYYWDDYSSSPSTHPKFTTVRSPGPIVTALYEYIKEQEMFRP